MALIEVGSMSNFAVTANEIVKKQKPFLHGIRSFSALTEVSRDVAHASFELITSQETRGLGIKRITLTEGFEGFLQKYLNPTNEIYFLAWAWDLSGTPIVQYPGVGVDSKDIIFPIKVGHIKEFIGEGINLFPKQQVKGGIAVRIQLWESDQSIRNFGKAMSDTADAIKKSELNNLLSLISLSTGVTATTITLIKDASIELAKVIGTILQTNGDDFVDFFEGYYTSDKDWVTGQETYQGNSSILTLEKF